MELEKREEKDPTLCENLANGALLTLREPLPRLVSL